MSYYQRINKTGSQANQPNPVTLMNTNTIQILTAVIGTTLVAGLASMTATDASINGIAATIAYLAVAAVGAIAISDYRASRKA